MPDQPTKETKGASAVVVSMADAARDLARQRRRRDDPPPRSGRGPEKNIFPPKWPGQPPNWTPNNLGLPSEEPCPVVPLGIEGELYHVIDSSGQFRSLIASDFSHAGLQSLFAAMPNWPQWAYPRFGRVSKDDDGDPIPPPIKSFDDDALRSALFLACTRRGLFSPSDKMRGRGMWPTKGGGVLYHAGEELWLFDPGAGRPKVMETGLHEGFFYPRFPALPAPWSEKIKPGDNPAGDLLTTLRMWNFARPDVDPVLLLGWVAVAFLGGALDWRSAVLLTGDKGTGKSTLQDGFKDLFGEALFHSADTTAAGIYQRMRNDARPIALDELEPGADPRKLQNVVQLMRDASSGAIGRRGGSDGTASDFQMRSAFLFSAINNPLHQAQDLSRVATLRLQPLPAGATKAPAIDADSCGRMLLAILMREWPRFHQTRDEYMKALAAGGHDARGQKTYGTLLAGADLLLGEELAAALDVRLTADAQWWTEHLSADALPEIEDATANWHNCVKAILSNQVESWRGGKRVTVGQCIADLEDGELMSAESEHRYGRGEAMRDLGATGLGLIHSEMLIDKLARLDGVSKAAATEQLGIAERSGWLLAVPPAHPLLKKLLRDTPWQSGGWRDALRQCPVKGVMITDKRVNRISIGGEQERCTLIVMERYRAAPER